MRNKLSLDTLNGVQKIVDDTITYKFIRNYISINNNTIEIILFPSYSMITLNTNTNKLIDVIKKELENVKGIKYKITLLKTHKEFEEKNLEILKEFGLYAKDSQYSIKQ